MEEPEETGEEKQEEKNLHYHIHYLLDHVDCLPFFGTFESTTVVPHGAVLAIWLILPNMPVISKVSIN